MRSIIMYYNFQYCMLKIQSKHIILYLYNNNIVIEEGYVFFIKFQWFIQICIFIYTSLLHGMICARSAQSLHASVRIREIYHRSNPNVAIHRINLCISDLRIWMIRNRLKMNDSKTEFLIITSSFLKQSFNDLSIMDGDSKIVSFNSARNLGVILDKCMKLDYHISSVCKLTYFYLRYIGSIRSILSNNACAQLIHFLFAVRLDYCNSILYGLHDNSLYCLQKIQNTAARILVRLSRFSHISATLFYLHWLPIRYRITFKICILTYQAYHRTAPSYLWDLIVLYVNTRFPRSNDKC